MPRHLNPARVVHGRFGKVIQNGEEKGQVSSYDFKITNDKAEIQALGLTMAGHKAGIETGTGTITMYMVNSDNLRIGFQRFDLLLTLEDPEAFGAERIMLYNCMYDEIGRSVGNEPVEEELPFTFDGYEFIDLIDE